MIVSLLTVGLLLIPSSNAFWRLPCAKPVLNARVDPIVDFGQPSSHGHTIVGSSAIGFSTTFDDLRSSNCTTCMVNDDRSNYWIPDLYYQYDNGSFQEVQHGGMLVYYLQRYAANETVEPFPDGLRMLTGDPNVRSNSGTPESQGISWLCLNFNGPGVPQTPGFANTNCPDGLRAQVVMPGCWDGVNLDSPDHKSHMAYPDGIDNGQCPPTHPHHLVTLFYEAWYSVSPFNALNDGGRFVLSTGDTTGYSLHGDFMNGWDKDVLSRAIQTCTASSGVIQDCPVFANENRFVPDDVMNSCTAPNPLPSENVLGPMPYLPGCIAVTEGPAPATAADLDPGCVSASPAQVSGQSSSSSSTPTPTSMPAPPANPPPSTEPASSDPSATTPASPSGTSSSPVVSDPTAPVNPPSGNNVALESPSSSSTHSATEPGSTVQPSSLSPLPAHPQSSSASSKPEPTGHDHHDPPPQKHGHHSQKNDHHSQKNDHHSQDQEDDSEYCHERQPPASSKKHKNARMPMRRRHHARRAGHASYMHL